MNAKDLLEQYERVAEATDAITSLKQFVLDLAIRGKLVAQQPTDEPAAELLNRIAVARARTVGMRSKARVPPEIQTFPFSLPESWMWTTIADIGLLSPRNKAFDDRDAGFVPMPLIAAQYGVPNAHEVRKWGEIKKGYTHFAEGDVGLAKITPCFENGKSTVFRNLPGGLGSGTTELHIVRPLLMNADFVLLFLKSPHFIDRGVPRMTGTAGQKRVPFEYFAYSPFPLPPLAEQHRIVAKVDELMALCDQLEKARAERETRRDKLTAATLARLNTPNSETLLNDARFALDNIHALTTRPDQIKHIRQAILDLAVRGRLVPQDSSDRPAFVVIEALRNGSHTGAVRRDVPVSVGLRDEIVAWDLPSSWAKCSAAELLRSGVLLDLKDGNHGANHPKIAEFSSAGIPFITAAQVFDHRIQVETAYKITGTPLRRLKVGFARKNDVIYTHKGTVGRVAVANEDCVLSPQTTYYRPKVEVLLPRYLMWFMESDLYVNQVDEVKKQTTRDFVAISKQYSFFHAIPPVAEQERIVAKVDELMSVCNALELALTNVYTARGRLLDALVSGSVKHSEPEEAQQTQTDNQVLLPQQRRAS